MHTEHASDHQRISFTAKLVALGRSLTGIPFARDVSELVGAPAVGRELARAAGETLTMPKVMTPVVEARYLSLVSAIKRSGVRQVLEFASGVSLRGLAMTLESPTLTYVETDLPDLTAEKRHIMQDILARHHLEEPRNHHVAVANILVWDEIEAALAPLAESEPVAVCHEGLFMYLSAAEKEIAARHIGRILDRYGGVWMTPDFATVQGFSWLKERSDMKGLERVLEVVEERTGRSFEAHAFATEAEARAFCERLGFTVEEHAQIDGSYELTSLPPAEGPTLLDELRRTLKLWEMRRRLPS